MRQRLNEVVKADRWGQMWSVYIGVEIEDAHLSIPRPILECGERQHCSRVDRRVNVHVQYMQCRLHAALWMEVRNESLLSM